ncbi:outer membrane beta-barrel protein [Moritella sp.]|uniref:outer membrane beta-barrel protein n=1 Tax=Moritella sp. TaxID=78556 RepID=UPI001D43B353|nr:outer membrane beta-barrel protein [Moritella sp.]MCJ8351434.1 DUF481 domain-containing protein [Moritella sp.]NQZ40186.1 outer membrane beta-barrel protein [Moritella sp.]
MKTAVLISSLLVAFSVTATEENGAEYRAYNTPVNYNFAKISVGQTSIDDIDIDATVIQGGGEGMINENWIYDMYYTGSLIDEDYLTGLSSALTFGVSYRFPVAEKLDLVVGGGVAYAWYDLDTYDDNDTDNDFGLSVKSSLRYGFTDKFEGSIGLAAVNLYDSTATTISGSISFYPTKNFGFGVSVAQTSDDVDTSSIGAHIKFNFN